ncbi:hypothetical protein KAI92_04085 [Candidatus Parcubacteria bacterium]|nr:hypothetical protein [Candidatus Parcubacteria bacterium]
MTMKKNDHNVAFDFEGIRTEDQIPSSFIFDKDYFLFFNEDYFNEYYDEADLEEYEDSEQEYEEQELFEEELSEYELECEECEYEYEKFGFDLENDIYPSQSSCQTVSMSPFRNRIQHSEIHERDVPSYNLNQPRANDFRCQQSRSLDFNLTFDKDDDLADMYFAYEKTMIEIFMS